MARDRLETAMLAVNRALKATRERFSRRPRRESLK